MNEQTNSHPIIGSVLGLLTGAGGIAIMETVQSGISICVGVVTLYLLYLQIKSVKGKK